MGGTLTIKARIELLPAQPGDQPAYRSGIRPNHNMGEMADSGFGIGEVRFLDRMWLERGETCDALVCFMSRPGLDERLAPGRTWSIQAAHKRIGVGTVLSSEPDEAFSQIIDAQKTWPD